MCFFLCRVEVFLLGLGLQVDGEVLLAGRWFGWDE